MSEIKSASSSSTSIATDALQPRYISELDGLRGILSWWVVVSHFLQFTGYDQSTLGRGLRILALGGYAVDVFIILSGFVIHKLWHDKRERFRTFITRRFLRIWPAYIVCLIVALALRPCIHITLANSFGNPKFASIKQDLWDNEQSHLISHVLVHIPMLHAAIPETILPSSSIALLGPAWSISLEWQFYLIAIPLFLSLNKWKERGWIMFACAAGLGWMFLYSPPFDDWFPMRGFLSQKLLLFGIGIASHELWRAVYEKRESVAPAMLWFATAILFITLSLPLAIWGVVFATMLNSSSFIAKLLNSSYIQFLGRVSYSTYLGHMHVIFLIQTVVLSVYPTVGKQAMLAVLLVIGTPLILLWSVALYRWVEKPAIALGRRLRAQ